MAPRPALPAGEWADKYPITLNAGQRVTAVMTSSDIDTYIVLQSPSGNTGGNDDCNGSQGQSCVDFIEQEGGEWVLYATS